MTALASRHRELVTLGEQLWRDREAFPGNKRIKRELRNQQDELMTVHRERRALIARLGVARAAVPGGPASA
jgi:hypothetical protein